jgi:hypothetical protein
MKRLLVIIALAGIATACNNSANSTNREKDSLDSIARNKKEKVDSNAAQQKDNIDSVNQKKKEALDRADSIKRHDSLKKK